MLTKGNQCLVLCFITNLRLVLPWVGGWLSDGFKVPVLLNIIFFTWEKLLALESSFLDVVVWLLLPGLVVWSPIVIFCWAVRGVFNWTWGLPTSGLWEISRFWSFGLDCLCAFEILCCCFLSISYCSRCCSTRNSSRASFTESGSSGVPMPCIF